MSLDIWPQELISKPRSFVALTGLSVDENPIHKSVWEGFSKVRRPDRSNLNFKLIPIKHEYPKCKTKRINYEWYVPKGILKSNWMHKHTEEVPSLIVVFYEMDWDDIQWKEKVNDCNSLVNMVKKSIVNRTTKIVVVLIQKRVLMPGEDTHSEQKAQYLCQACDLTGNRNLFVLPTTESLYGYITRLEKEFQDLSSNYYQNLIKKVKGHKECLNKTTHLLLFIRHHFKIAFYQEFRQEHALALKNYKQAYSFVRELRLLDTHLLEIKTVAGFINYKICSLSFQNNASDAINQFRIHIDAFKGVCGIPELAFEHEAWISKQFEVMADLFRDAIRQGLTAITTQHPGLYYEEAALHAIARKRFSHSAMITSARCINRHFRVTDVSYITDDPAQFNSADFHYLHDPLEFYGQRPWRQGKQSIEISDPIKERESIYALRMIEKQVNHSNLIILLLTNAMDNYQKYKANRMKLMSCVLMGEEYMDSGDYQQALKCFYKVMTEYRNEKWSTLLLPALLNSLKCTYMIALMPDYISICLELINDDIYLIEEEKQRIGNNLMLVLNNKPPEPELYSNIKDLNNIKELWNTNIKEFNFTEIQKEELIINMDGVSSSVDCKIVFPTEKRPVNQSIPFNIYLRSSTSLELIIQNIEITFLEERYNTRYFLDEEHSAYPIVLNRQNPMHLIQFFLIPLAEESNPVIKSDKVRIQLGNDQQFGHAFLQWSVNFDEYIKQAYFPPEPIEFSKTNRSSPGSLLPWNSIVEVPFVELIARKSEFLLEIQHSDPILINEKHPLRLSIVNGETQSVQDITVVFTIEEATNQSQKARLLELDQISNSNITIKSSSSKKIEFLIHNLEPNENLIEVIDLVSSVIGKFRLNIDISYKLRIRLHNYDNNCQCSKTQQFDAIVVQPFDVMTKFLSEYMIPIKDITVKEPFLVQVTTSNISSVPIEIQNTEILLNDDIESLDDPENREDRLDKLEISALENACEIFLLKVNSSFNDSKSYAALGKYVIHWKRLGELYGNQPIVNKTVVSLPDCSLDLTPLIVDMELEAHGTCKIPLTLTYIIKNKTIYPLEIEASLDMSDNFMYSGIKTLHQKILPDIQYRVCFCMLPLFAGLQPLPKFRIKLSNTSVNFLNSSKMVNYAESHSFSTTGSVISASSASTASDTYSQNTTTSNEKIFEQKLLSHLPNFIFVKVS